MQALEGHRKRDKVLIEFIELCVNVLGNRIGTVDHRFLIELQGSGL